VADIIEPGSTFKLVTAIAAVEQGVVDFDEIFETPENGQK
jgi:cell division protein FtsI/penicillin-binding protein 2